MATEPAATDVTAEGWCPSCKLALVWQSITNEERHTDCGHQVVWIDTPAEAGGLEAILAEQRAQIVADVQAEAARARRVELAGAEHLGRKDARDMVLAWLLTPEGLVLDEDQTAAVHLAARVAYGEFDETIWAAVNAATNVGTSETDSPATPIEN